MTEQPKQPIEGKPVEADPTPDFDAALDFLFEKWPHKHHMLCAFDPEKKRKPAFLACTPADAASGKVRAWLHEHNVEKKCNTYFHPNPLRDYSKASKSSKANVAAMLMRMLDKDPEPRDDPDEERVRIDKVLRNPPPGEDAPSCIVMSGTGSNAFYFNAEPLPLDGTDAAAADAELYNLYLTDLYLGDKACHNIDHVFRIPGTINWPDEKKRTKGRKPALARLTLWEPERKYDITTRPKRAIKKDEYKPRGSNFDTEANIPPPTSDNDIKRLADIDELGDNVKDIVKVVIVQGKDPEKPNRWPSRSEALFYVCCELVRAGISDEVIYSVITDPDFLISASVLEQKNVHRYATRQIQKAREFAIDPMLVKMNEKYAVIKNFGGRCVVVTEEHDPDHDGRSFLTVLSFEDITKAYLNIKIVIGLDKEGKEIKMSLGKWWLQHELRRQFNNVVFAANRDIEGSYNLWKGFSVAPKSGDQHLSYLAHIRDNVCGGELKIYEHLEKWMAWTVQYPGHVGEIAIVLRGKQGTGKGFFAKEFGKLFGRHFLQVSNPAHLVGNFNAHLEDCVVCFADEAFYAGNHQHAQILKTLVTEENILIERKRIDAKMRANHVHLILASDGDYVVPANKHERRFFVIDVADDKQQNSDYFAAIAKDLDSEGRENLLHYLQNLSLDGFNVRAFPRTEALNDQQAQALEGLEKIFYGLLIGQELPVPDVDSANGSVFISTARLCAFCDSKDKRRTYSSNDVAKLFRLLGFKEKRLKNGGPRGWVIPVWDEAYAMWKDAGMPVIPSTPEGTIGGWAPMPTWHPPKMAPRDDDDREVPF